MTMICPACGEEMEFGGRLEVYDEDDDDVVSLDASTFLCVNPACLAKCVVDHLVDPEVDDGYETWTFDKMESVPPSDSGVKR